MNNQQYIRYSDILDGKYEIKQLETISRIEKYHSPISLQTNHNKDLIQPQTKHTNNNNQLDYQNNYHSSKRHSQLDLSTPKLNISQVSQSSQMQTPNKSIPNRPTSPLLQNQFNNDNLLDQIDKLIKIRKLDQSILLRIIRKHMNDCPYFVQLVKKEFRNSIQSLK